VNTGFDQTCGASGYRTIYHNPNYFGCFVPQIPGLSSAGSFAATGTYLPRPTTTYVASVSASPASSAIATTSPPVIPTIVPVPDGQAGNGLSVEYVFQGCYHEADADANTLRILPLVPAQSSDTGARLITNYQFQGTPSQCASAACGQGFNQAANIPNAYGSRSYYYMMNTNGT
jgi:hypothetical protein